MRIVCAIVMLLGAAVLGLVECMAILDPVGTKMADDADPFGNASIHWTQHAALVVIVVACVAGACLLLGRPKVR